MKVRTKEREREREERERRKRERKRGKIRRDSIGGQIGKFIFAGAAELR